MNDNQIINIINEFEFIEESRLDNDLKNEIIKLLKFNEELIYDMLVSDSYKSE